MIFYDFEVFAHDWLVVLKNPETHTTTKIHNDPDALLDYYNKTQQVYSYDYSYFVVR